METKENRNATADAELMAISEELASCIPVLERKSFFMADEVYNNEAYNNIEDNENVVTLELTAHIENILRALPALDCAVFVRRYYYSEAISAICERYHLPEKDIVSILTSCRNRLKDEFTRRNWYFRIETLLISISDLSSDITEKSAMDITDLAPDKIRTKFIVTLSAIAGGIVCVSLVIFFILKAVHNPTPQTDTEPVTLTLEAQAEEFVDNGYVNTSRLLDYTPDTHYSIVELEFVQFSDYAFAYTQCHLKEDDITQFLTGRCLDCSSANAFAVWYSLRGHNDIQYIVRELNGHYALYELQYMVCDDTNTHSFYMPMYLMYDILESADIAKVIVSPANNSTGIQKVITGYYDIDYIYYAMSNMVCYGAGQHDLVSGSPLYEWDEIWESSVLLTIITTKGEVIDTFYYTSLGGYFYEFNNIIAYSKLSENVQQKLNEIFYSGIYY